MHAAARLPSPGGPEVLSVSDVNARAAGLLEAAPSLQRILVEGEVSKWFVANSGHIYFTLKDDHAAVDCVMWRSAAASAPDGIRVGLSVLVQASASMYRQQGRYQLQVQSVQPAGEGLLWIRFQELKRKLEAEGLFEAGRKRPTPRIPRRIGVVTSRDGAAFQDILHVLARRAPYLEVVLADARVQGQTAAPTLVRALERVAREDVDVIIIARGGGSMEDLWAFNEEPVVRAVAACRVPVISGVGHETDTTLVDFAADLRAPTPSAAAEKAALATDELHQMLDHAEHRIARHLHRRVESARQRFDSICARPVLMRPEAVFAPLKQRVAGLAARPVLRDLRVLFGPARQRLEALAARPALHRVDGVFAPARRRLTDAGRRLPVAMTARVHEARQELRRIEASTALRDPGVLVGPARQRVEEVTRRLGTITAARMRDANQDVRRLAASLDALSPLKVLARGYAVATKAGHAVRGADEVEVGDVIDVRLARGRVRADVRAVDRDDSLEERHG